MYKLHPPLENRVIDQNDPINLHYFKGITRITKFKFKIRKKKVYTIELNYFSKFVFVKYYPSKLETSNNKFKVTGMNLTISEIRGILETCSQLILKEITINSDYNYAFIGQPYDKDDIKKREVSKRFQLYNKKVASDFYSEKFKHYSHPTLNFYAISTKNDKDFMDDINKFNKHLEENDHILDDIMTKEAKNLFINN